MKDTVYFWQDGGAWQLGRRVWIVPDRQRMAPGAGNDTLVQHLYSNRLEWVPESKLQPYYGDNQPEGTK